MSQPRTKRARTEYPVHDLIRDRWSPYVFDPRPVERHKLLCCLEAARWAASSFNEQPWRFLVAERDDIPEFARMLGCLVEGNQAWARNAGALLLTAVRKNFTRNESPNRVAQHDLGLALGNFCVQATKLGLHVHQMGGILPETIVELYSIPQEYEPVTAVAVGYAGDPADSIHEDLAERDRTPRSRKSLEEFVFSGTWHNSTSLLEDR